MSSLYEAEISAGPPRIPSRLTAIVLLLALVLGACSQSQTETRGSPSEPRTSSRSTTAGKGSRPARFVVRRLPEPPVASRSVTGLVSTGDAVLVWGGADGDFRFADGARYDTKHERWSPIPPAPLSPRAFHSAVWTGEEMIVWGGSEPVYDAFAAAQGGRPPTVSFERVLADGAAYNPRTRQWKPIAPSPTGGRILHTTVWTGEEMIVWGGMTTEPGVAEPHADGIAYRPASDTWRAVPPSPLGPRTQSHAAWTGKEYVVVGGFPTERLRPELQVGVHTDPGGAPSAEGRLEDPSGAAYDPSSDTWRPLTTPPFSSRKGFSTTWDGRRLVVWGGVGTTDGGGTSTFVDGGAWDPRTNTWRRVFATAIGPRFQHVALAADGALLIWGGYRANELGEDLELLRDGGLLTGGSAEHAEGSKGFFPVSGPAAWAGNQAIVWGPPAISVSVVDR